MLAIDIPRDTDDLTPAGVIGLPVVAPVSGWLADCSGDLHLLIGQPQDGGAAHLLLRRGAASLTPLPTVPLAPAGVAGGPESLVVTGADAAGDPLVIGVSPAGEVLWRCGLDGAPPIRWPAPYAMPEPVVVWQVAADRIEIASIADGVVTRPESLAVGGPPLVVAAGSGRLWAAWPEARIIRGMARDGDRVVSWAAAEARTEQISLGAGADGAWMAWSSAGQAFLSEFGPDAAAAPIDLGRAAGGTLTVAAGPLPVVWAQRSGADARGQRTYVSALARPGRAPILFEGLVHAVAWWGGQLAVLGSAELWLLDSVPVDGRA